MTRPYRKIPRQIPGRFRQCDSVMFSLHWRHVNEAVEVVSRGKLWGYWLPVNPLLPPTPLDAYKGLSHRPPYRGTAAHQRLKPYLDALDEAEQNERILRDLLREEERSEDV